MSHESDKKQQAGKKNNDRILLLEQQLLAMAQMEALLKWSLDRCQTIPTQKMAVISTQYQYLSEVLTGEGPS